MEGIQVVPNLFDNDRNYVLGDPELNIIGDRAKLAQWRHKMKGPAFYKLGRKVIYRGSDLNAWAEANRTDPNEDGVD
ncbi:helix-turn-helix domain-containing protein [Sulfitobacter sp. AS59]